MRFFRKVFLPLFTVWLAFVVVLNPFVQSQMEVKSYFTNTPYYMSDFTLNGITVPVSISKELMYTIFYKYGDSIISKTGYNGDYYLYFSTVNYTDYYEIDLRIITVIAPWGIYDDYKNEVWYTYPKDKICTYISSYNSKDDKYRAVTGKCDSYKTLFMLFPNSQRLSDGTWVHTGSFGLTGSIYHDRNPEVEGDFAWSFNTGNVQNRTLSRQQLKKWAYSEELVTDEKQYCSYKLDKSMLTTSDKQILQSYDGDTGSQILSKVESLLSSSNNSIYNLINQLDTINKSITGTSAYADSAKSVINKLKGTSSNASGEGYYKGDDGMIHSFGGGATRGGGAGRDGGTETVGNHQVQRCYDVDTATYQPTGDIKINTSDSNPYDFTTENIYYITNNYYVNENYEIIEGFKPDDSKDPATDTDTDKPSTDTDIPPDVKPGDEWPADTPSWIEFLGNLISGLLQGLGDAIAGLGSAIGGIANALANLVSTLINALMDLIKMLFVPSDNFMSDNLSSMSDTVKTKLPVLSQVGEINNSVVGMLQGVSTLDANGNGAPSYVMQLPSWLGSGEYELFDFRFYEQYRTVFHAIISFCAWSLYLMRVPHKLANAIEKASK